MHTSQYYYPLKGGDLCMKGTISTNQRCPECGGVLKYVEGRGIFRCLEHSKITWLRNCFVRFGRNHTKRFKAVAEAERHLTYLRAQTDHDLFDIRDWQKNAPLSFKSLREKFLIFKNREQIGTKQLKHIEHVLELAGENWDSMSIKSIGEGEIDDFFAKDHGVGNKTLANYKSVLTDFWKWVVRREKRISKLEMPEFPDIRFKLGWRNITDIETQQKIVDEVYRISYDINPRIWLGIKLLTLYPKVRPGEMRNIQEGHINLSEGWIVFPNPKEKEPKFIHLLPEHTELIKSIREPRGLPNMYFFRHLKTKSGVKAGIQFGPKYFKVWWDKACKNIGIKEIDLYGGTKHSTVTALGEKLTPEQIQRGGTGHASDAFKRYMLPDVNEAVVVSQAINDMQELNKSTDPHLIHLNGSKKFHN